MKYTNPRYANSDRTSIKTDEGAFIPVHPGNADYDRLVADGVEVGDYVAPPAPVPEIPKQLILQRINDAGKLAEAKAALDADLLKREMWNITPTISQDDADAIALITEIGLDPNVILAQES